MKGNRKVGKIVRKARGSRAQREFAALIGISQSFLSEIENGRKTPGVRTAYMLSIVTGLPIEKFLPIPAIRKVAK